MEQKKDDSCGLQKSSSKIITYFFSILLIWVQFTRLDFVLNPEIKYPGMDINDTKEKVGGILKK